MTSQPPKHSFFLNYKGRDFYAEGSVQEIEPKLLAFFASIKARPVGVISADGTVKKVSE